ncbi:hypothetical protein LTR17_002089 [Elasticomyces elasticus]|nr:hypothetical protein LTR17_002089 [Elasticomyces elasticus]
MPVYALLGATGSTGSAILRSLFAQPPQQLTLNIFVRNKSKLLKAFPDLESTTAFKVNIIEGTPSHATAMQDCLRDVDVAMACIATNYSTRGMSICYDTAAAIIDALQVLQKTRGYKPPTIIQLRSASVNRTLSAAMPWVARNMAAFCFHYVYEDLRRASILLTSAAAEPPGLLHYIFVDPPAIHDPDGTTPTGFALITDGTQKQESALGYSDLGAAFCELAERRDEFRDREVGPTATGEVNLTVGILFGYLIAGLKSRILG